jgi:ABC-type multidrug transport system ATPase subunit
MIQTFNLSKSFGSFTAVDGVNLEIQPGEIYGFLGPNGAGKTTILMMILGVLKPSKGTVQILGQPLERDPFGIKRRIGVVVEAQNYYEDMTPWEYLMFFGRLYQVEGAEGRAQMLLERVGLWKWRNVLLSGFSSGMQRKLSMVRALLHSPDILILDEPVANLDPYGIIQIRELLADEHAAGRTILISSHILSEVERMASRIGILAHGRLLFEDTMDNLKRRSGGRRQIEIELADPVNGIAKVLQSLTFVDELKQNGNRLTLFTQGDRDYRSDVGRALTAQGAVVQGMRSVEPTLEEAFITITEEHVQDWARSKNGS